MKRLMLVLVLVIVLLGASIALAAPDSMDLTWWTVDGGASVSQMSGGTYTLQGTTGQPDAGILANGSYSLTGGFWNNNIINFFKIYLPAIFGQS